MPVRFKCQTEYQRSYRSRSVSPQRWPLFAGLRSDHMGISREPCLQRRKKFIRSHSCGPPHQTHHEKLSKCPTAQAVLSVAESEAPSGKAGASSEKPMDTCGSPAISDQFAIKSQKPSRNSSVPPNQQQSPTSHHSLRRKAGLGPRRHRLGLHETEYNQQFGLKKRPAASSPILTAHQALYSTIPPFKKNPVAVDTEYQRSFQGRVPPKTPALRENQEQEQTLLTKNKKPLKKKTETDLENVVNRPESFPKQECRELAPSQLRRHRLLTEYESRFCVLPRKTTEKEDATDSRPPQIKELREQALLYRRRAWGTHFSRDHLSQLQSEHNALWEPTETIDSASVRPQSPCLDLCQVSSAQPDSGGSSCVEALDLESNSSKSVDSKKSSALDSEDEEMNKMNKITEKISPQSCQNHLGEKADELNGIEEGRLPTPKLKMLPVQRTHFDLTTPATGGAVLVGKLKDADQASVVQRSATADSGQAKDTTEHIPVKPREAWSADSAQLKPASSPVPKPVPSQSRPLVPSAFPLTAPLHCIQGTLRHADFQHNGDLGLRFKEHNCATGCCGSDEDERLSVMSWRSAASCSLASAVLERAQRRRDDFWGKR